VGARGRVATLQEIRSARESPFVSTVFGVSLDEIMELQAEKYPDEKLPMVVKVLIEKIRNLDGYRCEGIFRVPGDTELVQVMRIEIDNMEYNLKGSDPNTPASLLKLWLRELAEPLIPADVYARCIADYGDSEKALAVVNSLPELNRRIAKCIVHLLQDVSKYEAVNKMSVSNLAMVFAPNFLRCPSQDPQVIFENTKYEQEWLKNLISNMEENDND